MKKKNNCREYLEEVSEGRFHARDKEGQQQFLEELRQNAPECADEVEKSIKMIDTLKNNDIPDPGKEYWERFAGRVEERLEEKTDKRYRMLFTQLLRVAAVLALGVFIGYLLFYNPKQNDFDMAAEAEQRLVAKQTAGVLEDSKVLILGMINLDEDDVSADGIDFAYPQEHSQMLLKQTADLRNQLQGSPNRRVLHLLDELELILRQIANMDSQIDMEAVDVIRGGVQSQDLILKIDLEQLLLQGRDEASKKNTNDAQERKRS